MLPEASLLLLLLLMSVCMAYGACTPFLLSHRCSYFKLPGLAELSRILLKAGDVEFEDVSTPGSCMRVGRAPHTDRGYCRGQVQVQGRVQIPYSTDNDKACTPAAQAQLHVPDTLTCGLQVRYDFGSPEWLEGFKVRRHADHSRPCLRTGSCLLSLFSCLEGPAIGLILGWLKGLRIFCDLAITQLSDDR
jgi:hypothetical protein